MTARADVSRFRVLVAAAVAGRAALLAAAVAALAWGVAGLAGGWERARAATFALLCGVLTLAWLLARWLDGGLSLERVALWIEGRVPALRFALVTAVEQPPGSRLEEVVRRTRWVRTARRSLARSLARPAVLALLATLSAWGMTGPWRRQLVAAARPLTSVAGPTTALAGLRAEVRTPAYAGGTRTVVSDPAVVRALAGSDVTFTAPLPPLVDASEVLVRQGRAPRPVSSDGGTWRASVVVGSRPSAITFSHAGASRVVSMEARPDSAPAVTLARPVRDTVVRATSGRIEFEADLADDIGLQGARAEYVVSSGEGERFTFRTGVMASREFGGGRRGRITASLDLGALTLGPGDVVHVRVVARDGNTVTGPGIGYSDTRVVRIARRGEYDSVAMEAAPPPEADRTLLSQRMLINLTEALVARERALSPADVTGESRRIARDQTRLRRLVSDLVFSRLGGEGGGEHSHGDGHGHGENELLSAGPVTPEQMLQAAEKATAARTEGLDVAHDEAPIIAINRPLLEAYNAMWDAGRELDQGLPRRALPPMYLALAAIQRARAAERLYLRGASPPVVIDLAKVRLQGREFGGDAERASRPAIEVARWRALDRLDRGLDELASATVQQAAAVDSILILRLDLIERWPVAAAALERLATLLRAGRPATDAAIGARRALAGSSAGSNVVGRWGTEGRGRGR